MKMVTFSLLCTVLAGILSSSQAQEDCSSLNCGENQYCFDGSAQKLCLTCNQACKGCSGPGPKECDQCAEGYHLQANTCTECPHGQFGSGCNGTCHCLDNDVCDHVTGECVGKCAKGYAPPPFCQKECQEGFYGLDCVELCHCMNDSVCDKETGFCPNNLCHPDYYSSACSKRLPMLSSSPTVFAVSCQFFTVTWRAWEYHADFGDPELPVDEYRLYSRYSDSNDSTSDAWKYELTVSHNPSVTQYTRNVTILEPDAYYQFRVDVHGADDGKVVAKASMGLVSEPPILAPCATSTVPPPVTVPIVVGADIITALSASLQPSGDVLVGWTMDPQYRSYTWNLTLSHTLVGIGDCAAVADGNVTSVTVEQSEKAYRIQGLAPWSRYLVQMDVQGLGIVSAANDTDDVTVVTSELAPNGTISQERVSNRQSTSVTLSWSPVACAQRGGALLRYDVTVRPKNGSGVTRVLSANVTSLEVRGLKPYTEYVATAQYVNRVGAGPYSRELVFTTTQGVPSAVAVLSLKPMAHSVEVKVKAPDEVNGVLLEYYILYSDTATFTQPESLTFNVSSPGFPIVQRLKAYTIYYFKVRGRTVAGYGPYGAVAYTRTLQAKPHAPEALLQTSGNLTCVTVTWLTPDQSAIAISGYTLTLVNTRTGQGSTVTLDVNLTSYTHCDLDPGSAYNLFMTSRSGAGSGKPTSILVTTEQPDPPAPPSPTLVDVSPTFASVEIEPVTLTPGVRATYQLQVERVTASAGSGRRKRLVGLPGYVTAQLSDQEVTERLMFVIGDGQRYGRYINQVLEPDQTYHLYYAVVAAFYNLTKFNYTRMDTPIRTPVPPTTTEATTPSTEPVTEGPSPEDDNGVLIGVIVALLLLILLIVLLIIFILWWRRRRGLLRQPPPYFELDDGQKNQPKAADPKEEDSGSERYWNQITSLRESRYIVVGRECVPDSQLMPVSTQVAQPGVTKVTFKMEFRSLPKEIPQATTRKAERYPDRNRFPHILPFDHTLVELAPDRSSRCSYINASSMSGYKRQRCYIAAQSPYDERTAVDFWRLIHQNRVKTVLLVANGVEENIVKCTQYWPREGKVTIGQFHLELRDEAVYADFTVREVTVRESGEQHARVVRLYDYTSWPEHGIPGDPIPFLDLRYKVRQYHGDEPGPILVHCGTGVGRTAVFIAVDSLIDKYANEGRVSVYSFVRKMRKERPLMVRTLKQYQFIYDCLLEEFHAGETMTDSITIKTMYRDWTSRNTKTGRSFLRDQFQLLHQLTVGPSKGACKAAHLPDNAKRNRYADVVPSDQHRPELRTPAKFSNTDYINAIFVDGYRKQKQFILTQTPLHTTLVDFWRMVYDHHVTTVVMMDCYKHEDDTCAQYWPEEVNMKQWEPFFVESTASFEQEDVTIRNLKVVNTLSPHEPPLLVRQFQFNAWAKNSFLPASKTMLLNLLDMVIDYQASSDHPESPIVVHCGDGATHSGLFVCLALVCERMEEDQEVDVYHVIKHVKRRRPQIIPDYDQLRFCYKTLWDYINLRMTGGTFTDTMGQTRMDYLNGVASLSLTSFQDTSLY